MPKYWETRKFHALSKRWNDRLEKLGFEDIEEEVNGERLLKKSCQWELLTYVRLKDDITQDARREYYKSFAYFCAQETDFADDSDSIIMERLAEGRRIAEISRELKARGLKKHNRDTIRYVRRRYEHKWGIKFWKPEQMVSRKPRTR